MNITFSGKSGIGCFVILCLLFFMLIVSQTSFAAGRPTPEDIQAIEDNFELFKNTLSESSSGINKMRKYYLEFKKEHRNDPKYQDIIKKLDEAGFSSKLRTAYKELNTFDNAAGKVKDAAEFYNRYKPDENDPTRSLKQISSLIEDAQKIIPLPEDLKKPITEILTFYAGAAKEFAGALKRLDTKMDDYRQGTIGTGGKSDVGGSEQIKQYYRQGFDIPLSRSGDIILFEPAEVWESHMNNMAFLWDGTNWYKLEVPVSFLKSLYTYHLKGMGSPPQTDRLLVQAQSHEAITDRIMEAKGLYDTFMNIYRSKRAALDQRSLLETAGKLSALNDLILEVADETSFIGKYLYSAKVRKEIGDINNIIDNYIGISGNVFVGRGEEKKGLSGAVVSAGKASARTLTGGKYDIIMKGKKGDKTTVSVLHKEYPAASRDIYFESNYVSGIDFTLGEKDEETLNQILGSVQGLTREMNKLNKQFSLYYNHFIRIARTGQGITSNAGVGVGTTGICRALSYSFVQAQKKLGKLNSLSADIQMLEMNLKGFDSAENVRLAEALKQFNAVKDAVLGPNGFAEKFREMREQVRRNNCTEEHLHFHADGVPDDLRPEFANNLIGTEGEIPSSP